MFRSIISFRVAAQNVDCSFLCGTLKEFPIVFGRNLRSLPKHSYLMDSTNGNADETKHDVMNINVAEDQSQPEAKKHDLLPGPKRKVAMYFAYCGENYHGMVMNRGERSIKTIEGALITALVKVKLVPENCWDCPDRMCYKIASRTDKGVSTCGQIASLKMILHENAVKLINDELPHDIRILAIKQATKGFSAHLSVDSRTYSYTMPTYAFAEPVKLNKDYRITEDKLKHVQSLLFRYKGTHTFHNFTSGKKKGEDSAKRYIQDMYYEPPFIKEDIEFLTIKIKGQSFMIHQIRKMIGLMIAIISGYADDNYFNMAFTEPLSDIPKAPGIGLVLEKIHYDGYNRKFRHLHGGIDFPEVADQVEDFRQTRILPYIYRKEREDGDMRNWLETLPLHDYTGERARQDWERMTAMREEKRRSLANNSETEADKLSAKSEVKNTEVCEADYKTKDSVAPSNENPTKDPSDDAAEPTAKKTKLDTNNESAVS